jgi:hypothetical protein
VKRSSHANVVREVQVKVAVNATRIDGAKFDMPGFDGRA